MDPKIHYRVHRSPLPDSSPVEPISRLHVLFLLRKDSAVELSTAAQFLSQRDLRFENILTNKWTIFRNTFGISINSVHESRLNNSFSLEVLEASRVFRRKNETSSCNLIAIRCHLSNYKVSNTVCLHCKWNVTPRLSCTMNRKPAHSEPVLNYPEIWLWVCVFLKFPCHFPLLLSRWRMMKLR